MIRLLAVAASVAASSPIAATLGPPTIWNGTPDDVAKFCRGGPVPAAGGRWVMSPLVMEGSTARCNITTTVGPGASLAARLVGPSLAPCAVDAASDGYALRCDVRDAGAYALEVLLMFENETLAFAPGAAPGRQPRPLCRPLTATRGLPSVDAAARAVDASRPCSSFASRRHRADVGRWTFRDGALAWAPSRCAPRVYDRDEATRCLAGRTVLFVGDSHTRLVADALAPQPQPAGPDRRPDATTKAGNWTIRSRGDVRFLAANKVPRDDGSLVAAILAAAPDVVVVNMGHWDLRDVNVEAYVDAWKAFVDALAAAAPETTRLVWRTNPAYSFRRHDDREVEYRTNAKLAKAHALQLAHLRRSRYDVHDTFGITLPRFFDANSAHHYIGFSSFAHGAASVDEAGTCPGGACCGGGVGGACPWVVHPRTGPSRKLGAPYYVGNAVGLADLNALLNSLCNVS
ncbi:hypothetical protein AURANDRAFT_63201 [Aureococcus anophagefferens]|uniref:SGNH hydrolase-type esterase domain-containing protein n=1 Tax=Aureococcus anophagefferens TaxID=44056 RepID=F0Y5U0_AURAN|nr:hypothetical protein AURANDRAFT_63201 [Aureococcus anophagefferens]EGB09738.1 hypothetical protein AURANDRAFT_63201 [Aureococcus anophagefferens]|eukprot:XP_009035779.1 hypothetical protein AURANDRAFT_63201 [Aureococcus anophagefferens]